MFRSSSTEDATTADAEINHKKLVIWYIGQDMFGMQAAKEAEEMTKYIYNVNNAQFIGNYDSQFIGQAGIKYNPQATDALSWEHFSMGLTFCLAIL